MNGPMRVHINNYNGSVSNAKSHYAAYSELREQQGAPVQRYSRKGVPEGFHHADATNGVGKPIAHTHQHLAASIRDTAPKHVYDKSAAIPASHGTLCHHNPPRVDYRQLPPFKPHDQGATYASSDYGYQYRGRGATFDYADRAVPAPTDGKPLALPPSRYHAPCRTTPGHALPPAGRKTSVYESSLRAASLYPATYPAPSDVR